MKTLIIAEAGVNHNGDLLLAQDLIRVAASAGADIVKFQTFTADKLVTKSAKRAEYQIRNTYSSDSQTSLLQGLELTRDNHLNLQQRCGELKIEFLSSGFDIDSLKLLVEIGQKRFKVPSGEITNLPYLRFLGKLNREVIISTGMATLKEVEDAINVFEKSGTSLSKITLLHCTSNYPAAPEEVNLNAMLTLGREFGLKYGYSDHTRGTQVATAAVALGACVIEKHFTLNRNAIGPDHKASLEPDELANLIRGIRIIETAMGNGVKNPTETEKSTMLVVRKSIVALSEIQIGEKFTELNIGIKRPGSGISPMLWDNIVGQVSKRSYQADELITIEE